MILSKIHTWCYPRCACGGSYNGRGYEVTPREPHHRCAWLDTLLVDGSHRIAERVTADPANATFTNMGGQCR
jgi:hypothetical protein